MKPELSRRSFLLGTAGLAGAGLGLSLWRRRRHEHRERKELQSPSLRQDPLVGEGKVVVARGESPRDNVRRALEACGVIPKLVKPGHTVVVKPNMAWDLKPEQGANAHPETVAAVVAACLEAARPGGRVVVFDRTMSRDPSGPYRTSGIAEAASRAGGVVHRVNESRFYPVDIPDAYAVPRWSFYEYVLFADLVDVLINIPCTKTHSTSGLTLGMKNVFGMVGGERGNLHQDIHHKIVDLNRVVQVDLTVLDATRVMFRNGPNSPRPADVTDDPERARRIVVGTDPVAVDAYAATLFGQDPASVGFVRYGAEAGLGSMTFTVQDV